MNNQPLVSIIIPTYNRAHLIGETLDSVLVQTYTNWECIIVDDGSTDNTFEVVQNYLDKDARFQFHHRPSNRPKGANACRNYGFEVSEGVYIQWLDSDDFLKDYCLNLRVNEFLKNLKIDFIVFSTGIYKKSFSNSLVNRDPNTVDTLSYLQMFLSYRIPWPIHSIIWKRNVIDEVSFDEDLIRFQDYDFHIRILLCGKFKFKRVNIIDNFYRINLNTYKDLSRKTDILKSLQVLLPKTIKKVNKNEIYLPFLKEALFKFYKYYVIPIYKEDIILSKSVENIIFDTGCFKSNEIFLLKLNRFIISNKISKIKGLGLYRFTRFIYSKFEKQSNII